MRPQKYPLKAANKLIQMLDTVLGMNRYPVNIKPLALDYSRQCFPNHCIQDIKGDNLPGFEGALYGDRRGDRSRWLILYNNHLA